MFSASTLVGTDKFQALQLAVDRAREAVDAAGTSLRESIKAAIAAGPLTFSPDLFTNCTLNQQIGSGPLHLSKATHTLVPGASATVATLVTGGQRPYIPIMTMLPEGVSAAIDTADILTVSIDSKVAVDGVKLIVPVRDSRSATVNLYIQFYTQQQAGQQSPSDVTPPTSVPDDKVKKIQEKLERAHKNLGAAGADGLWGEDTKAAVVEYLKENFDDLKGIDKFADDFRGMESAPDFSVMNKDKLIAYVLALPD